MGITPGSVHGSLVTNHLVCQAAQRSRVTFLDTEFDDTLSGGNGVRLIRDGALFHSFFKGN